jgi:hypothetical protein
MPLSRLENFLKNAEGNILYVNSSDFDATDSIENRGNSQTRPFKTIQRALIEAARFSYQTGKNNDKIDRTTILVYPGTHYIDNRPGYTVINNSGAAEYRVRKNAGWQVAALSQFTTETNFDVLDPNNELYKYNSTEGGVILPRGTSIIGLDLRKTKIRPLYVPDPEDAQQTYGGILRVTGTCYFTAFTIFDADIAKTAYYDYDSNTKTPTYSHHKLAAFTYADGVNSVVINGADSGLTDLDMYYYKVSRAYGDASGRPVGTFPTFDDFEPNVDEFRIVGDLAADPVGISSIKAGDGNTSSNIITVNTTRPHGLFKDTPVLIAGITTSINSYNGSFLVEEVLTDDQFRYLAPSAPSNALPTAQEIQNSSVIIEPDTVGSASPYIFNCSLRSVYGLNGLDCDGDKATGFKSMVAAQFTGISIQKDDNAFILYNPDTAIFNDDVTVSESDRPLHSNSRAIYKPSYESSHMRVRNNAVVQLVSIFAIAYARHFHAERGGDASITNSNSNFGQTALEASGFRPESFNRDDVGYITHIIPPREIPEDEGTSSWLTLDTAKTIGVGVTERLYIYNYNTEEIVPPAQVDSFRVGARRGDTLNLSIVNTLSGQAVQQTFSTPIMMQVNSGIATSAEKVYKVIRNSGVNAIISNVFLLEAQHQLVLGEKVRIFSNTGETPNGVINDKIYYAIAGGTLAPDRIQIASTYNDALARRPITGISNGGGKLSVVSKVADKNPGDPGHPIQWDSVNNQWYILGSQYEQNNTIFAAFKTIGAGVIGGETGTTYVKRRVDNRSLLDRIYRARYVIPKEHIDARAPKPGFILQESKSVGIGSASFLTADLSNPTQLRNVKVIKNATYSGSTITFTTELQHRLQKGDLVKITNVSSSNNTSALNRVGYNGEHLVSQVLTNKQFSVAGITTDPGVFLNQVNQRTTQQQIEDLPTVQRSKSSDTFTVYRVQEAKPHVPGISGQDGIYNITMICGSIALDKDLGFGVSFKSFSQDVRNLYPQQDRDNYESDPQPSATYANADIIGNVVTNDRKKSVTRESLSYFMQGQQVGYAVTGAVITGTGNTTITLYTDAEHQFNQIKSLSIIDPGSGYNNGSGIATVIYAADLENNALSGRGAAAEVQISAAGTVTSVKLIDGGTNYGIGNTMTISAFPSGSPTTNASVQVDAIFNNLGDALTLSGFEDPAHNGTFKIVDIPTSKSISVEIGTYRSPGPYYTERDDRRYPTYHLSNIGVGITYINVLDRTTGVAQVLVDGNHTLVSGNCFTIHGTSNPLFDNRLFVVDDVDPNNPLQSIHFNVGIITSGISTAYSITNARLFGTGISANAKTLGLGENNLAGRASYFYAGISTTIAAPLTTTDTTITLTDIDGFRKGDYCIINGEIVRFVNDNINSIVRGQFGTLAAPAITGTTIKKINVLPMELRRPSILRASGHTFEYLGYGSGNYSTSLPQKQDRVLTDAETLAAQKKELDGGTVVYTGMNDSGDFYTGYKRLSSITGEEEIIEAPVFTYTGDDAEAEGSKRTSGVFDEVLVRESITVEGGDNNNRTSQFYGPVNFTQKLTNNSTEGIETVNFFLRGDAPQGKLLTVGISTPTGTKRSGDLSFVGIPDAGGYLGHIYAEGEWRRFGAVSQERDRSFYKFDQLGIGQSGIGIFNFRDALEVNGVVKVKDLYVAGIVTFASNQTFSGVTYDTITIRQLANFWGYNTTGGISPQGIPWENYGYYTIVDEGGVARLNDIEVVGTAVTFKPAAQIKIEGPIDSTFAGVSTFVGTLDVGNIESDGGTINVTFLNAVQAGIDTLAVHNDLFARNGMFTNFSAEIGAVTNGLYVDVGITTLAHIEEEYVNVSRVYTGIVTNLSVSNYIVTPQLYAANAITTNTTGTNAIFENITGVAVTATDLHFTDDLFGPDMYVQNGIVTSIQSRYIGGLGNAGPGQASLQVNINSGIITSLVGYAGTFQEIYMNPSGRITVPFMYANTGIITNLSAGNNKNMVIDAGDQGTLRGFTYTSVAGQGVAPFIVASSTKVTNLNADFLDGYTTSWDDQSGNTVVVRQNGDSKFDILYANSFNGGSALLTALTVNGTSTLNGAVNINGNLTVPGGSNITGTLNGNASTATLSTHVVGSSNRVLYNNSTNNTTTSGNLTFNGSTLTVNNLTVTGTFTGSVNGNAATATLASNVAGSGGRILYNQSNNSTTTSSNLTFDGSSLRVGGDITAFASDIRLKTNIKPIENAIAKVLGLSGFTYDLNETAEKELGLTNDERLVGVSAQEVLEVLPEAVRSAPANENYLTVQYEKIVPLLIEAIKEQQSQIEDLKSRIQSLEGK